MDSSQKDYFERKYKTTINDCKILYKDNFCNHWDVQQGWYNIISEFSYLCEELNIRFYKKYRMYISIGQVKQKYGTLRIYASIVQDPCRFSTWIIGILKKIISKLNNINYNFIKMSNNPHSSYVIEIYDTEDELINDKKCGSNVTISQIKDKFIKTVKYMQYTKTTYKPTKFRIIYYIKYFIEKFSKWIYNFSFMIEKIINHEKNNVIMEYMNTKLDKLISEYERKSEHICEKCGYEMNTKHDSICYTTGWITTLCELCAEKSGHEYEMNGKIYKNGIFVRDIKNEQDNL